MSRDLAFEALAEVTNTHWEAGRGELNFSLAGIRKQTENMLTDELLAAEIRTRADLYRQVFPNMTLSPTALNKHWERVVAEKPKPSGSNLSADRPPSLPLSRREQNLQEARKILEMFK